MTRPLLAIAVPPGAEGVDALRAPFARALAGNGPAVAPVPEPSEAVGAAYVDRVRAAVRPDEPVDDDRCALVVATSGSVGRPSGVLLTADNLAALQGWAHGGLPRPQWILALPLTGIAGLNVLARSLATDAPLLVWPGIGGARPFAPADFAAVVATAESGAQILTSLVPEQLRRLLADPAGTAALARCTRVLIGGEAAPTALLDRARSLGIEVIQTYGCTETTGGCVFDGVPGPSVEMSINATDGRIRVAGPTVALGYRDVAFNGDFLTADVGEIVDGRLRVLGRIDDIVQVKGVNVSLAAIAETIGELPEVREVHVVAGPPITALVAGPVDGDLVGAKVQARVQARVKAALGAVARPEIVAVSSLPRLPNGKVDRAAAQELAKGDT